MCRCCVCRPAYQPNQAHPSSPRVCACVPRMSVITAVHIYGCNLHPPLISSSPSSLHCHQYVCAPVFQMFTWHLMLESGACFCFCFFYTASLFFFQREGKAKKKGKSETCCLFGAKRKIWICVWSSIEVQRDWGGVQFTSFKSCLFCCACVECAWSVLNAV